MTNPTKAETLRLLKAQVAAKEQNRLKSFVPYPKQREFFDATALPHTEVGLQVGNQFGKSTGAAYMSAVFATGMYPPDWQGRVFDGPTEGWVASESTVSTRDTAQALLCGPPANEELFGTGFIPKSMIVSKALSHGASGAFDNIGVRHVSGGISTIAFKSYEQSVSKFQSKTLHWAWLDEEAPLDIYMECLARMIATNGLLFSSYTPLYGLGRIVPRFREGNSSRVLIRGTYLDAPHLADPARREALLKTFPAHQIGARLRGEPLLGSGAVWEDVSLESLIDPIRIRGGKIVHDTLGELDTSAWAFLWGIDFGIAHPFAAVLIGWDRDRDIATVLTEVKITGGVPQIHASRMKTIAENAVVAWPHDGTQRDKGSGEQLAMQYKREGLNMLPMHSQFSTGGYSTEAGIMEMLTRMRDGRLKIASSLVEWKLEFENYHRKDGLIVKENDDLLSATRQAIMMLRFAKLTPIGSGRRNRMSGPYVAEGAELSRDELF